jgi:hypothetical protein
MILVKTAPMRVKDAILVILAMVFALAGAPEVLGATTTITSVSGGSSISATNAGGAWTTLTGPVLTESSYGAIGGRSGGSTGTIILAAPSGFQFNTSATVTVKVNGSSTSSYNINQTPNNGTIPVTVTSNTLTMTVTSPSSILGGANTLTWQNIQVRPTAGSPLASGSITESGTCTFQNLTGSWGSLTEVLGPPVKLLVLMPGETAAPGTPTGKTGTPVAQQAGSAFTVRVNAVDSYWNLVSSTHTVSLTSSDTYAVLPASAALVAGTNSFTITLKTATNSTVTASDTTGSPLASGVSTLTTVNPGAFAKLQALVPGESALPGSTTGKSGAPLVQTNSQAFVLTVNGVDANWNIVNTNDTIQITSSDLQALLPTNAPLAGGTRNFTVTLKTLGVSTLTASNVTHSGIVSSVSSAITVAVGQPVKLLVLMPGETAAPGTPTGKTGTPVAQQAGSAFTVTVNAVDNYWNLVSSTHTVALTSSDTYAVLPASASLVAGTNSFTITLKTATNSTVTVSDTSGSPLASGVSSLTTVNPGAFAKLQALVPGESALPGSATGKSGAPLVQTNSLAFVLTVNGVDANWNIVNTNDTIQITSSDLQALLPTNAPLAGGTRNFTVTLKTLGVSTLTASNVTHSGIVSSVSSAITVAVGQPVKLLVLMPGETAAPGTPTGKTGTPVAQQAGSAFTVTVNAVDNYWNLVSSTHTVALTSSDTYAILPASAALVAGTNSFTITLKTATNSTVTASDTSGSPLASGVSTLTTVNPGPFAKLQLLVPGEAALPGSATGKSGAPLVQTNNQAFALTVNGVDANWNIVNTNDTIQVASSDLQALLPTNAPLAGGTRNFTVTLKTVGVSTLTASNVTHSGIVSSVSSAITVAAGQPVKLLVLMPGETAAPGTPTGKTGTPVAQQAGSAFTVTVNAVDSYWNLVSNTHTVALTSSDTYAALPASAALVAGTNSFTITLKTATNSTVTVSDTSGSPLASGVSSLTTVNPGAFAKLQLLVPGEAALPGSATGKSGAPLVQTNNQAFALTVNGVDANWNIVNTNDTIQITSSDLQALLPTNAPLAGGTCNFTVTLKTVGASTLTASNVTHSGIVGSVSSTITVAAGQPVKLLVLMPGETAAPGTPTGKTGTPAVQRSGSAFTVTVNAVDSYWNLVSSTHTVSLTSSDTYAALPASAALVAGTNSFTVTLKTATNSTVTANDTSGSPLASGVSPLTTVNPGAFAKLQVLAPGESALPGSTAGKTGTPLVQTNNQAFALTVNGVDANWNIINTNDTIQISSSDLQALLPTNAPLAGGTRNFNITLKTVGVSTLTASNVTHSGIVSSVSSAITVAAGPPLKLLVLMPGETAAPGTPTGKTGTPAAQRAGSAFTVTVNAVDSNWNLVSSTHTVALTSSDTYASLPASAALVAGTNSFTVTLKTATNSTVTATPPPGSDCTYYDTGSDKPDEYRVCFRKGVVLRKDLSREPYPFPQP